MNKFLYWTPRILSILLILFLTLFSFDIFDMNLGFWGTILGLLIHNLPSIILSIIIYISWKHEIVGGIAFILSGLLYIIFGIKSGIAWYIALSWSLIIAGPAFLIGTLFFINWYKKQ